MTMEKDSESLTKIVVDLPEHWSGYGGESFWAESLGDDLYRLENVPFHAYGLNYHDIVRAEPPAPDRKPEVIEVVERSGHQTLRIIFQDHVPQEEQKPYLDELRRLGGTLERSSAMYLAIDLPPGSDMAIFRDRLEQWWERGIVEYETCEMRVHGSFTSEPDGIE